jgi:hypothetical protein
VGAELIPALLFNDRKSVLGGCAQPSAKAAPPADNIFHVTLQDDNDSGQQGYGRHIVSFAPKQHHIPIASSITTKNTADSVH